MNEHHRTEPTTPTETTRRQLFTALTGGLLALLGPGAITSQSATKRKNKRTARLVPLPRIR